MGRSFIKKRLDFNQLRTNVVQSLDRSMERQEVGVTQHPWVRDAVAGIFRFRGRFDLWIDRFQRKRVSPRLKQHLYLGLYAIENQQMDPTRERVPLEKALAETVGWIMHQLGLDESRFGNALFRATLRGDLNRAEDETSAAWWSLPDWLWASLQAQYPEKAREIAKSLLERPTLWARGKAWPEGAKAGVIPGSFEVAKAPWSEVLKGLRKQSWYMQDLGAQIVMHEALSLLPKKGHALDLCAAPGGKARFLLGEGWKVTVTDHDTKRMGWMLASLTGVEALSFNEVSSSYDLVVVDAPCTATGLLRRHPDLRYKVQKKALASLREIQAGLIQRAQTHVKTDGHLLYIVCSLLKEEGEQHNFPGKTVKEWRLFPHEGRQDGFYGRLLRV